MQCSILAADNGDTVLWFVIPGVLLGILLAFLALPIVISVRGTHIGAQEPTSLRAEVAAFWGALGLIARQDGDSWQVGPRLFGRALGLWFRVKGSRPTDAPSATPDEVEEEEGPAKEEVSSEPVDELPDEGPTVSRREHLQRQWTLIRPLFRPAWRLIKSAPRAVSLRRLQVDGRFGLDDPAATGQLQGALYALQCALPARVKLNIAADFVSPGLNAWVSATVHLYLGVLLLYIVRTAILGGVAWLNVRLSLWRLERTSPSAEPVTGT